VLLRQQRHSLGRAKAQKVKKEGIVREGNEVPDRVLMQTSLPKECRSSDDPEGGIRPACFLYTGEARVSPGKVLRASIKLLRRKKFAYVLRPLLPFLMSRSLRHSASPLWAADCVGELQTSSEVCQTSSFGEVL
jgi:hypothetical protein